MPTVAATWGPGSGRDYVDITTTYAGEATFPTTPVVGSQIEFPDTGTMDNAGVLTIADGTYTLYHITPGGQMEAVSYTQGEGSGSEPGDVTVSAQWLPGPGRDYAVLASGFDATVFEFFEKQPTVGWQVDYDATEITFSNLALIEPVNDFEGVSVIYVYDPETSLLHYGEIDASQLQTAAGQVPQGTIVVGTITKDHESASIPFTYAESDADSFEHSTNGTDWTTVTSPISRTGLDAETAYSGQIRAVNATGAATPVSYNFTTDAEPVTAPTDAPVIGTITKDHESASIPFGAVTGATAYEYSTDSGSTWTDVTSPLALSSLTAETAYSGQIRGYNSAGPGPSATYSFTTDAEPLMPPSGTLSFGAASVTTTTISLPTSYDAADADSFEYRVDDGAWTTYTSPITLSGLNSETTYAIDAKPVNADGDGTIISTTVTTLAASGAPLERQYTLVAGIDSLPQAQQFTIYQGERVRFIIDHDMDLTDRTMILRIAPALGSPAKVSVNANDSQFLITSAISEEMSPANKVWQILVKQGDERVVVADGTAVVKQRIKEQ